MEKDKKDIKADLKNAAAGAGKAAAGLFNKAKKAAPIEVASFFFSFFRFSMFATELQKMFLTFALRTIKKVKLWHTNTKNVASMGIIMKMSTKNSAPSNDSVLSLLPQYC